MITDSLKPNLIENNVKYFIGSTLNSCHKFKENYFNNIFNVSLLVGFIGLLAIVLFIKYKGNKSAKEIELTKKKDRDYIIHRLLKLKQENIDDRRMRNNLITNMPFYNETTPMNKFKPPINNLN